MKVGSSFTDVHEKDGLNMDIVKTLSQNAHHQLLYEEGRKELFYLMTHSTHFIYGYMASDMVKDHSDSERGNPLPPHGLLFPINSKESFICIIP